MVMPVMERISRDKARPSPLYFIKTPFKNTGFIIGDKTLATIFAHENHSAITRSQRGPDGGDCSPISHGITHKVVEYLLDQGIGKHFCVGREIVLCYVLSEWGPHIRSINERTTRQRGRGGDSGLLLVLAEQGHGRDTF